MANISGSFTYLPRPLDMKRRMWIKSKTGLDIPFEFTIWSISTGDGTSTGTNKHVYDFPSNFGQDFYYAITNISWATDDSAQKVALQAYVSSWQNMAPGVSESVTLWESVQNLYGGLYQDQLTGIIYLGRAVPTLGNLTLQFEDHAGTCDYKVLLQGYALKSPLPLSAIFQQNPMN